MLRKQCQLHKSGRTHQFFLLNSHRSGVSSTSRVLDLTRLWTGTIRSFQGREGARRSQRAHPTLGVLMVLLMVFGDGVCDGIADGCIADGCIADGVADDVADDVC